MNLNQYMNLRLLHGHSINCVSNNITQLIEIDANGNNINQYYYILNYDYNIQKNKIAILTDKINSKLVNNYQYAIACPLDLTMTLMPLNNYYLYKLYDFQEHNTYFMWVELNNYSLLTSIINMKDIYVHNRLFSFLWSTDKDKKKFGDICNVRNKFKKLWYMFNNSLQNYINQHIILTNKIAMDLSTSFIFCGNDNTNIKFMDYTTNKEYLVKNKNNLFYKKDNIIWPIKCYNIFYCTYADNYFYILKFTNDRIYILCQFTKESFKIQEYIKWQLNYALLAHIISTKEYQYLLNNIQSIYDDFNSYIKE